MSAEGELERFRAKARETVEGNEHAPDLRFDRTSLPACQGEDRDVSAIQEALGRASKAENRGPC